MQKFIETPRKKWGRNFGNSSNPQIWILIFMGLLLINTVTFSFIPLSQSVSLSVSILFMVLIFFPLLYLGFYLANKFGYGILFAGFLSLPGAGIGVLVLGDFFGVLTGRIIAENISVRKAIFYPQAKIFSFQNSKLLLEKKIIVKDNKTVSENFSKNSNLNSNAMNYALVPVIDEDYQENEKVSVWAVCAFLIAKGENCFQENAKSGFQVNPNLRPVLLKTIRMEESNLDLESWESPIFLILVPFAKKRVIQAGYFGLALLFFINLFWIISVLLYYRFQKK
jgi:hypothetical protein